ncbi:Pol protein [Colletotrichum asianum]
MTLLNNILKQRSPIDNSSSKEESNNQENNTKQLLKYQEPQYFHDKCKEHIGDKHNYQFYPRRLNNKPIKNVYTTYIMIGWTITTFNRRIATFQPSPQFPMRCQHNNMKWDECQRDECQIYYQDKARAWRIAKDGPRPPQVRIRENSLTKARREGKQITYPGHPEQSKN